MGNPGYHFCLDNCLEINSETIHWLKLIIVQIHPFLVNAMGSLSFLGHVINVLQPMVFHKIQSIVLQFLHGLLINFDCLNFDFHSFIMAKMSLSFISKTVIGQKCYLFPSSLMLNRAVVSRLSSPSYHHGLWMCEPSASRFSGSWWTSHSLSLAMVHFLPPNFKHLSWKLFNTLFICSLTEFCIHSSLSWFFINWFWGNIMQNLLAW